MEKSPQKLPEVASFWHGAPLTWVEQLCIQSFIDRGHSFVLYSAEQLVDVPPAVIQRHPASVLWPPSFMLAPGDRFAAAVFSDIFRLELLTKTSQVWVDLDAYCVRPLDFATPWIFTVAEDGTYPTGILGLPRWSAVLARMRAFVNSSSPSASWRSRQSRRNDDARRAAGETWTMLQLPWGSSGPRALRHFMNQSVERQHALPYRSLYGLDAQSLRKLHNPRISTERIEGPDVHSVHIYGRQKKILATRFDGLPVAGSYLDRLCRRHGIDPKSAPIAPERWMRKLGAEDDEAAAAVEGEG